jgi:hypothetical protein
MTEPEDAAAARAASGTNTQARRVKIISAHIGAPVAAFTRFFD